MRLAERAHGRCRARAHAASGRRKVALPKPVHLREPRQASIGARGVHQGRGQRRRMHRVQHHPQGCTHCRRTRQCQLVQDPWRAWADPRGGPPLSGSNCGHCVPHPPRRGSGAHQERVARSDPTWARKTVLVFRGRYVSIIDIDMEAPPTRRERINTSLSPGLPSRRQTIRILSGPPMGDATRVFKLWLSPVAVANETRQAPAKGLTAAARGS